MTIELIREYAQQSLQRMLDEFSREYLAFIDDYTDDEVRLLLDFTRRANRIVGGRG